MLYCAYGAEGCEYLVPIEEAYDEAMDEHRRSDSLDLNMICIYDEAFTIDEMLEETCRCKNCELDCPNKGKTYDENKEK